MKLSSTKGFSALLNGRYCQIKELRNTVGQPSMSRKSRANSKFDNQFQNYLKEGRCFNGDKMFAIWLQKPRRRTLMCWLLVVFVWIAVLTPSSYALLMEEPTIVGLANEASSGGNVKYNSSSNSNNRSNVKLLATKSDGVSAVSANEYLDKLDNLERSVAAVLIKVAYGTTSTTKRSIPDNSYIPSLTTVSTPLLTTLRYLDKSAQHQQFNVHHRNYELDLERDHALPTSAPNADILKSNSNPTYPNPNRHHSHERERHRHVFNSTPSPALPNLVKTSNGHLPRIPMYPGEILPYSPPTRAFFTPPLPPEYQNPFADKPTLRGTNNEGIIANTGNRRPIPPPSLMPGHERIPFRPPDLAATLNGNNSGGSKSPNNTTNMDSSSVDPRKLSTTTTTVIEVEQKKLLNTPSRVNDAIQEAGGSTFHNTNSNGGNHQESSGVGSFGGEKSNHQEVLPSIRRILSGSNGKKGDIPEVLLKQVTTRPIVSFHQPPSSPVVLIENTAQQQKEISEELSSTSPNINKSKQQSNIVQEPNAQSKTRLSIKTNSNEQSSISANEPSSSSSSSVSSTPAAAAAIGEAAATSSSYASTSSSGSSSKLPPVSGTIDSGGSASSSEPTTAAAAHITWNIAWNVHVYLSVILFTILAVYSFYKILTYNKLTHLFSQSYFLCIHLILIGICTTRIFYLCYDAYNIHASFHIFVAELLLNLPATFLTVSFSVLILFLFLKSLNHKNNRYSALIRPLTVVVGCGVHIVLCITLHYVESYTLQNQHIYYQQQQQQKYYRRQQQQQLLQQQHQHYASNVHATLSSGTSLASPPPPPRVLTLICQIIYIFICLSLGLLYLYLYRMLKRILRSKSQNYIHGYQNLSYAIHITIATALLFVLLAALQIFGAISISTVRPLITPSTAEMDWLQWGYQFSLRLIEIAIITLISWVTGLKVSSGGNPGVAANGDIRVGPGGGPNAGAFNGSGGSGHSGTLSSREKHGTVGHHHHSNVANFFLPCTSSSSQEQFDTDYPAICNANTNLHTYTMRTGKLIYDDSYALNSLGPGTQVGPGAAPGRNCSEYQLQQPTYQHPYDTGSMHSTVNHNISEYGGTQGTLPNHRYHQLAHDQHHYQDYLTDATTDHYENPNFDLRGNSSGTGSARSAGCEPTSIPKFVKNLNNSTTALNSGGSGSSAASQQQMLLLQSDSCYSEPLQENSSYEFNNFERPTFGREQQAAHQGGRSANGECWPNKSRDFKSHMTLDRGGYEHPERRSSNSTNSGTSNGGGGGGGGGNGSGAGGRYVSYNSFDRGYYNGGGIRKSGTLNNIVNNYQHNGMHGRTIAASGNGATAAHQRTPNDVQTLALSERHHYHHRNGGRINGRGTAAQHELMYGQEPVNNKQQQLHHHPSHNSDDDEEDDMISGSNVECTTLINNEGSSAGAGSSCVTNSSGNGAGCVDVTEPTGIAPNTINSDSLSPSTNFNSEAQKSQQQSVSPHQHAHEMTHVQRNPISIHHPHLQQPSHNPKLQSGDSTEKAAPATTAAVNSGVNLNAAAESMLVAEQGFLRFRALDDINNAQGVGIHNASIRKGRGATAGHSNIDTNSINC